jgi:hypothetical protein
MFGCKYCHTLTGEHHPQCPSFIPVKSKYKCIKCGDNILIGEEYIVNDDGDYAHYECVDYAKDMAKFLGFQVKEMEGD